MVRVANSGRWRLLSEELWHCHMKNCPCETVFIRLSVWLALYHLAKNPSHLPLLNSYVPCFWNFFIFWYIYNSSRIKYIYMHTIITTVFFSLFLQILRMLQSLHSYGWNHSSLRKGMTRIYKTSSSAEKRPYQTGIAVYKPLKICLSYQTGVYVKKNPNQRSYQTSVSVQNPKAPDLPDRCVCSKTQLNGATRQVSVFKRQTTGPTWQVSLTKLNWLSSVQTMLSVMIISGKSWANCCWQNAFEVMLRVVYSRTLEGDPPGHQQR